MKVILESLDVQPVIYGIRCKVNNKIYVGQATNYFSRFYFHIRDLENNKHHCKALQNDFNEFGKLNFEIVILKEVNFEEDLNCLELEEMSKIENEFLYNSRSRENKVICYNSKTGEILGTYFNISVATQKTGISFRRIYNACYTEHQPLDNDEKSFILEINKDKIEARLNNVGQGNCFTKGNEYAYKKGGENPHAYKKGGYNPHAFKGTKIIAYDKSNNLIKEYGSIKEAASDLGLVRGSISNCLIGRSKSTGGYTFKYA